MIGPIFARRMRAIADRPPPTPTNAERIRAYRALAPLDLGNGWRWKWHSRQYAAEAAPSSEAEYAQQLREGFEFKYGETA